MRKDAEQKTEPIRTIHHTESGHSVDRAELLRSERVRKVISEVADKLKVSPDGGISGYDLEIHFVVFFAASETG